MPKRISELVLISLQKAYEEGILSLRELDRAFRVSKPSILKLAKEHGWIRGRPQEPSHELPSVIKSKNIESTLQNENKEMQTTYKPSLDFQQSNIIDDNLEKSNTSSPLLEEDDGREDFEMIMVRIKKKSIIGLECLLDECNRLIKQRGINRTVRSSIVLRDGTLSKYEKETKHKRELNEDGIAVLSQTYIEISRALGLFSQEPGLVLQFGSRNQQANKNILEATQQDMQAIKNLAETITTTAIKKVSE